MPGSTEDLLLGMLERAATGDGLPVHDGGGRTRVVRLGLGELAASGPDRWPCVEALRDEGLIELRSGVYRATAAGVRTLRDRCWTPRPGGAVAVMFTDLEGSTRLIDRFGDAGAHALLRRHFALLRAAVAEHHGHEVKSLGDGLMVVFAVVPEAVACAAAMQAAVAREGEGVGLRIGIHVGEPVRDEDDYFGTPVIIARRLCDAAASGQTVVSEPVSRQVAERRFESLGGIALKGLREKVMASALAGEGMNVRMSAVAAAV